MKPWLFRSCSVGTCTGPWPHVTAAFDEVSWINPSTISTFWPWLTVRLTPQLLLKGGHLSDHVERYLDYYYDWGRLSFKFESLHHCYSWPTLLLNADCLSAPNDYLSYISLPCRWTMRCRLRENSSCVSQGNSIDLTQLMLLPISRGYCCRAYS